MEFGCNQRRSFDNLFDRTFLQMKVNPTTVRYYEEYQGYLTRMKTKDLYDSRLEHQQHLEKLKIDNTQRARELDRRLGQNIDITV